MNPTHYPSHLFEFFLILIQLLSLSVAATTTDRGVGTQLTYLIRTAVYPDYLNGEGTFTSTNLAKWTRDQTVSSVSFTSVAVAGVDVLKMEKTSDAPLAFLDHHLTYQFSSAVKPVHLTFEFYSTNVETEDNNLRLLNTGLNKTVVLFRCGNAGFVRVNDNQMIDFYNTTIEGKPENQIETTPTWTRADLFLDWEQQKMTVHLNQTYKAEVNFYMPDVTAGIDAVRVYNLKPKTTSYFKNIQLCASPTCDGYLSSNILAMSITLLVGLFVLILA